MNLSNRSLTMDPKAMRASIMQRVSIPDDLLQAAIARTRAMIDAKKTQFFAHQGEIISKVDVEDHDAQLRATDQVYKLAGVYARESDSKSGTPNVSVTIDTNGVVRLTIGAPSTEPLPMAISPLAELSTGAADEVEGAPSSMEDEPEVIRVSKKLVHDPEFLALVFGDD